MEVVVTGASGFIGRSAVAALRARGHEVHVISRHPPADPAVDHSHAVDLFDAPAVEACVRAIGASHLLHLAWNMDYDTHYEAPDNHAWADATVQLGQVFRDAGGARLVFAGTCAQYEWTDSALAPDGIARERTTSRAAHTLYGRCKEQAATRLAELGRASGLEVATGVMFIAYGPFDDPLRLIPSVITRLMAGQPAETTIGAQSRDFVHVHDCAAALAMLVEHHAVGPVNIGTGTGMSVSDVARRIARMLGREDLLRVGALPMREGEATALIADTTRLHDEIGFTPVFDLDAGLRHTIDWWRQR